MAYISIDNAMLHFDELINSLETRQENEIIVTRNNTPIASLTLVRKSSDRSKLFGCAKGILKNHDLDLDEFNSLNEEIAKEFEGNS